LDVLFDLLKRIGFGFEQKERNQHQ